MSTGTRLPLADAEWIVRHDLAPLWPACERIEVAGSLRRRRADVGDIELVAIPRVETIPDGFFATAERSLLDAAVLDLVGAGILDETGVHGERYVKLRHRRSGAQVDLFIVRPPAQFGVIFTIRTGPADYSRRLVTEARRHGLHVVDGALHRGGLGCGAIPCEVIPTPEERDFYAALGEPWVRPEYRA